jgi:hypothetical protein
VLEDHQESGAWLQQAPELPYESSTVDGTNMVQYVGDDDQSKAGSGDRPKVVEEDGSRAPFASNFDTIRRRVEPTDLRKASTETLSKTSDTATVVQDGLIEIRTHEPHDAVRLVVRKIPWLLARSGNAIGVQRFVIPCICVEFGRHFQMITFAGW